MDAFVAYSIPIQGLKFGIHHFIFSVDKRFFSHFEGSLIEDGEVHFRVQLDMRSDMFILDFDLEGFIRTECDRCTALINLPIEDHRQLVVKYGDADGEEEDEVVFIQREAPEFNVAKYLYEFTVLAMPMIKKYDCESEAVPPCNVEVLEMLEGKKEDEENPAWEALKKFKEKP